MSALPPRAVRLDDCPAPAGVFRAAQLLLVEGVPWQADIEVIRSGLIRRRRRFKEPFHEGVPDNVAAELARLGEQCDALFALLYPSFRPGPRRNSFRPMLTGPEPMHFDTYLMDAPLVTSFVNVSRVPRVYRLSYSLEQLIEHDRRAVRDIIERDCRGKVDDFSYRLRERTWADKPPLHSGAPREEVKLPPLSWWLFDAKRVSHEVVYGEGAMGFSWPVPGCGAPLQGELLEQAR